MEVYLRVTDKDKDINEEVHYQDTDLVLAVFQNQEKAKITTLGSFLTTESGLFAINNLNILTKNVLDTFKQSTENIISSEEV